MENYEPESGGKGGITLAHVFLLIVLAFGATSAGLFLYDAYLHRVCTEPVEAVVSENVEHVSGSHGVSSSSSYIIVTIAPVFEYEYAGQAYRVQSSTSTNPPKYKKGEHVTLFLNPADPKNFRAGDDNVLRILAALFGGFFAVFAGAFVFISAHLMSDDKETPLP